MLARPPTTPCLDPQVPMGWASLALSIMLLAIIIGLSRMTYELVKKPCRDWVKRKVQAPKPQHTAGQLPEKGVAGVSSGRGSPG